jgi:hypothetical protein
MGENVRKKKGRSKMNEDTRKEVKSKLTDEERVRRLREGGESMNAQLAMEETGRAGREGAPTSGSYPVSAEEQERRRLTGTGDPYRGYGETQRAEMAMWNTKAPAEKALTEEEMRRTGSARVAYESGTGSYYSEMPDQPTGSAGPESSFGRNERIPSGRQYAEGGMSDQDSRRMMTQDEMRRSGSDQTAYSAGSGSYYTETFERPTGSAGPESSFGRKERTPSGRQFAEGGEEFGPSGRNLSQDEMRRTGSNQTNYPAGGGSYYTETFERPTGSAGPESSFGRTERIPSGRQYAGEAGRMGATGTMGAMGGEVITQGKAVGGTAIAKTQGVTSQISTKAKEFSANNPPEEVAHRAGESLGRAIRKTVAVAKGMASGFNRGLNPEKSKESPAAPESGAEGDITLRTKQEVAKQTPRGQEKKQQ